MTAATKRMTLRRMLRSGTSVSLAGAHDGLGARLVQEAGFDGVWASGFELSASRGVPDASILSADDMLSACRSINEACDLPVLADCDTGYGNAINVIHTIRMFEAAGIAGICIEDSVFPKRCSFYAGVQRQLTSREEFGLKIAAAIDSRSDPDFVVIARTETFVAGGDLAETLGRARWYADAGADAVLVHSKHPSAEQIAQFAAQWDRSTPLVCVPTTYGTVSVDELARLGFRVVIFANYGLRSSVKAMRRTLRVLREHGRAAAVDDEVVPLSEIYRLVDLARLKSDERRYLPEAQGQRLTPVIIVGAAAGDVAVPDRQLDLLAQAGPRQIWVVGCDHRVGASENVRALSAEALAASGGLVQFLVDRAAESGAVIVSFRSIIFDRHVLEAVERNKGDIALVCDRSWAAGDAAQGDDLVIESPSPRVGKRFLSDNRVVKVTAFGVEVDPREATAQSIGLMRLTESGARMLLELQQDAAWQKPGAMTEPRFSAGDTQLVALLAELVERGHCVASVGIYQGWAEIVSHDEHTQFLT